MKTNIHGTFTPRTFSFVSENLAGLMHNEPINSKPQELAEEEEKKLISFEMRTIHTTGSRKKRSKNHTNNKCVCCWALYVFSVATVSAENSWKRCKCIQEYDEKKEQHKHLMHI